LPNFIPVRFAEDQGGYLAGALAASVTRTSMVGAVCETAGLPSMWRACEGFRMGALSINPEAKVTLAYHDADFNEDLFTDEEWARQAAADLFHQGADVILGAGGRLGQAAVRAAGQAGIWSIGWDQDAFFEVPEAGGSVLASVLPDASSIVPDLVRSLGREREAGQPILAPMILSPYHGSERFIPESVQRRLAELASDLRSGAVVTNVPEKRPEGE
jgi:basic membrane protein A